MDSRVCHKNEKIVLNDVHPYLDFGEQTLEANIYVFLIFQKKTWQVKESKFSLTFFLLVFISIHTNVRGVDNAKSILFLITHHIGQKGGQREGHIDRQKDGLPDGRTKIVIYNNSP